MSMSNARVIPFDRLRMTDVDAGRRQERVARRDDQPARRRRHPRPGRLRDDGVRLPRVPRAGRPARRASRSGSQALDVDDVAALARGRRGDPRLDRRSAAAARRWRPRSRTAYRDADADGARTRSFAVRSSATAEDLPDASFAGQQETFLNINGLDNILHAIREVFASLYNDRAIAYRVHQGFAHADVALSAGVQRMVRSDLGAAGVMFTLDTESGFDQVVFITVVVRARRDGRAGRGEPGRVLRLQAATSPPAGRRSCARRVGAQGASRWCSPTAQRAGQVDGDRRRRRTPSGMRFSITDAEAEELARYAVAIEKHYGRPMDIEWGRDGVDGKLYILQARPETVKSREGARQPAPLPAEVDVRGARDAAARSARRSGRARCGSSSRRRKWTACRPATCWSPT